MRKLFFFGALGNTRIFWDLDLPRVIQGCTDGAGRLIRINMMNAYRGDLTPDQFAMLVLGVVAHEALHAFQLQYACNEHVACVEMVGLSGHGTTWQSIAFELEKALRFARFEGACLKRRQAAITEAQDHEARGEDWSPSREDVLRYFGGGCPVTGTVYRRDWREKLKALFKRCGKLMK